MKKKTIQKKENIDLQRQLRNKIESLEQKLKEENDEEKKKACEKEIKETKEIKSKII